MRLVYLFAAALVLTGCSKFHSNNLRGGNGLRIYGKGEAVGVLTRDQRWCHSEITPDGLITTEVFKKDSTGEYAIYDRKLAKFVAQDQLAWDLQNDILSITLPAKYNPHNLSFTLRFSGPLGNEGISLLNKDGSVAATLSPCPF